MTATSPRLQDRLDELERSLPPLPARILRFQRDAAARIERDTSTALRRLRRALDRRPDRGPGDAAIDESLSRAELYRRAQQEAIPGRSSMNKAELLAALRHA